jgi:putative ABC transport system permease protein
MQAKLYPGLPFQFSFLEEEAEQMYDVEFRTGRIIRYFTLVSILISFLGLFGMVVFELELRTREIAIRKVLNSSISQIMLLVFTRYLKWIVLAFLIATPISFYVTSTWLQAFAFRIRISPVTYLLTLTGIVFIEFLIIGFQSRRSAMANPAQILKFE